MSLGWYEGREGGESTQYEDDIPIAGSKFVVPGSLGLVPRTNVTTKFVKILQ